MRSCSVYPISVGRLDTRDPNNPKHGPTALGRAGNRSMLSTFQAQASAIEGLALWHLNRTSEGIPKLLRIREELLNRPDSMVQNRCLIYLSSSYIREGRWDKAREFALEAWVSARRIGSKYQEGIALGNLC